MPAASDTATFSASSGVVLAEARALFGNIDNATIWRAHQPMEDTSANGGHISQCIMPREVTEKQQSWFVCQEHSSSTCLAHAANLDVFSIFPIVVHMAHESFHQFEGDGHQNREISDARSLSLVATRCCHKTLSQSLKQQQQRLSYLAPPPLQGFEKRMLSKL